MHFNSMNSASFRIAHHPMMRALLICAFAFLSSYRGSHVMASDEDSRTGQVVITDAINKTFTPEEVNAVKIAEQVGITLAEKFPCGVELQFPMDIKPGTYPIEDRLNSLMVNVFAQYSPDCGESGYYLSTRGTLKLTESGGKYSGSFEFTAANNRDQIKTVQISGSFADEVHS